MAVACTVSPYTIGLPIGGIVVMFAASFLIRYANDTLSLRRLHRAEKIGWDQLVATLRLRLPPGSELVTLEHQVYFRDERNRTLAKSVFEGNGFEVKTAETYDKQTKYWLLAARSTLIDHVTEELQRVFQFTASYGGRYDRCNPQL
jgi:hypothetical protein